MEECSTLEVVEVPSFIATTVEVEEEQASSASSSHRINYEKCWVFDSGYSNHITGDKNKLCNASEYKGKLVLVTPNNSQLPITHIGDTVITSCSSQ